jgi:hypothetical protein
MKTVYLAIMILSLLVISSKKKTFKINRYKTVKIENNLTKELKIIEIFKNDKTSNSDELLNENGFLISNFNDLNENEKLNYSLSKGYI